MNRAVPEMMPIFHHNLISQCEDTRTEEGFSLLEMLVVLAIMGIVVSLVGVRLVSSIESTRFIKTAEAAVADIKLSRLEAMLDETSVVLRGTGKSIPNESFSTQIVEPFNLPASWVVKGDDISISKTGFCSGGNITLTDETKRTISFSLLPPKCEAERDFSPQSSQ